MTPSACKQSSSTLRIPWDRARIERNFHSDSGFEALFGRIKIFYQRHAKAFSALLTAVVLVVWLLGPVLADVLSLAQSIAISLAIVLVMLGLVQEFLNDLVGVRKLGIDSSQSESNRAVVQALSNQTIEEVRMIEYDAESTKPLIFSSWRRVLVCIVCCSIRITRSTRASGGG